MEAWPPAAARLLVSFKVSGQPRPAGSKNAMPLGRRIDGRFVPYTRSDGRPIINMRDNSGERGANWRADIRQAVLDALDQAHGLCDGPLAVRTTFFIASPKSRLDKHGEVKSTAARYPHKSKLADGDKLSRALHDALTSLVWTDDSRVCECWWTRSYGQDGARVDIYELPERIMEAPPGVRVADLEAPPQLALDASVIIEDHGDSDPIEAFAAIVG